MCSLIALTLLVANNKDVWTEKSSSEKFTFDEWPNLESYFSNSRNKEVIMAVT